MGTTESEGQPGSISEIWSPVVCKGAIDLALLLPGTSYSFSLRLNDLSDALTLMALQADRPGPLPLHRTGYYRYRTPSRRCTSFGVCCLVYQVGLDGNQLPLYPGTSYATTVLTVCSGRLGRKTGGGFYGYSEDPWGGCIG
jgi:hypothetical protein